MNINVEKQLPLHLNESSLLRLRAERDRLDASQRQDDFSGGCQRGSTWAQQDADYADLKSLAESNLITAESLTAAEIADLIGGEPECLFGADYSELSATYLRGWLHGINVVYDAV